MLKKNLSDLRNTLLQRKSYIDFVNSRPIEYQVARLIRDQRIHKGMTQGQLAKLVKTAQPNIARIESGTHSPSIKTLKQIARALGVELDVRFVDAEKAVLSFFASVETAIVTSKHEPSTRTHPYLSDPDIRNQTYSQSNAPGTEFTYAIK